jgi:hypothetical protein
MSKCSFTIPFSGSTEDVFIKAKAGITGAGGIFAGNASAGEFSLSTFVGEISGTYDMQASAIHIEILNKPIFLSCSKIEEELKKNLRMI